MKLLTPDFLNTCSRICKKSGNSQFYTKQWSISPRITSNFGQFVQKCAKAKIGWLSLAFSSFLSRRMTMIWMWLSQECHN